MLLLHSTFVSVLFVTVELFLCDKHARLLSAALKHNNEQ